MKPDKKFGQHWLNDPASLLAMVEAGEVATGDTVLEVGPGLGALTLPLLEAGAKVVAVEYDGDLIARLEQRFNDQELDIVEGDILEFDLGRLPAGYKVVANIPYYLTSKLLRKLSEADNVPSLITLLVQKEVAERIAAEPGKLSILGVSAQLFAQVHLGKLVPAGLFEPPPKVDSQIVSLRPRTQPLFSLDKDKFFRLVHAGFGERRKKLANSLSGGLAIEKDRAKELIEQCGFTTNIRAQELSLQQWYKLYNKFYPNGQ